MSTPEINIDADDKLDKIIIWAKTHGVFINDKIEFIRSKYFQLNNIKFLIVTG